jgi:hypothetical protein
MNLMKLTYDEAERAYLNGQCSSDEWVQYRCAWRNSTVRFSTLASEHDGCGTGPCKQVAQVAP